MKSKARTLIGKQESNRINARLQPAIQSLISGKDDDTGESLTNAKKQRFVRDIKNAIDVGMVSRTNARVRAALSAAIK
jgi:hypothetical protein